MKVTKLRDDKVGRLCVRNKVILQVGSVFYRGVRRKRDKAVQLRRTVRIEMRRLGSLYLEFRKGDISNIYGNAKDMFLRVNFDKLGDAIDSYSVTEEGKLKPGLKQNLLYLLKRSVKSHCNVKCIQNS